MKVYEAGDFRWMHLDDVVRVVGEDRGWVNRQICGRGGSESLESVYARFASIANERARRFEI